MWLAARVHVKAGVTIGEGTVVTAGSVVETSLPADVIAGGAPARVLRSRKPNAPRRSETQQARKKAARRRRERRRRSPISPRTISRARSSKDDALGPSIAAERRALRSGRPDAPPALAATPQNTVDFAVVWTRPERVSQAFARLLLGEPALDADSSPRSTRSPTLIAASRRRPLPFVPTWTLPPHDRGLGMLDMRQGGVARALVAMNLRLAETLELADDVPPRRRAMAGRGRAVRRAPLVHGQGRLLARGLRRAAARTSARRCAASAATRASSSSSISTTRSGAASSATSAGRTSASAATIPSARRSSTSSARSRRSRSAASCSPSSARTRSRVALEAIRRTPRWCSRQSDFAGWRINWRDKAQNIAELVAELNLGLQSVVFIDDNPVERARVREALPEVLRARVARGQAALRRARSARSRCFDAPPLSREDVERTQHVRRRAPARDAEDAGRLARRVAQEPRHARSASSRSTRPTCRAPRSSSTRPTR